MWAKQVKIVGHYMWTQNGWKEPNLNVLRIGQHHCKAINSQTPTTCRWQPILKGGAECFIQSHSFVITRLTILEHIEDQKLHNFWQAVSRAMQVQFYPSIPIYNATIKSCSNKLTNPCKHLKLPSIGNLVTDMQSCLGDYQVQKYQAYRMEWFPVRIQLCKVIFGFPKNSNMYLQLFLKPLPLHNRIIQLCICIAHLNDIWRSHQ